MTVHLLLLEKQMEIHEQVAEEATQMTIVANETLRTATKEFTETVESLKKTQKKELSERDRTIKILVIALLIITGCCTYLGTRVITTKC